MGLQNDRGNRWEAAGPTGENHGQSDVTDTQASEDRFKSAGGS